MTSSTPSAPTEDGLSIHIARALARRALAGGAAGALAGLAAVSLAVLGVRLLQGGATVAPGARPDVTGPAGLLLVVGTLGGVAIATAVAWVLMRPIESWFRRGGLAMISGFSTFLLMWLTVPAEGLFGVAGLLGLALLALAGAALLVRVVYRPWGPPA